MPILNQSSAASEEPRVVKKIQFSGHSVVVQLFGVLAMGAGLLLAFIFDGLPLVGLFGVGVFLWGIVLVIAGASYPDTFLCSKCGNSLEKTSNLCPACKEKIKPLKKVQ